MSIRSTPTQIAPPIAAPIKMCDPTRASSHFPASSRFQREIQKPDEHRIEQPLSQCSKEEVYRVAPPYGVKFRNPVHTLQNQRHPHQSQCAVK